MMTLVLTNPDILVKFLPNISSNMRFMKTEMSTPFMKARVFAARVLQATLSIFLDSIEMPASFVDHKFFCIQIELAAITGSFYC